MIAKHRVLIVGAGSIGERHTRCFLATGRVDVVICEVVQERCRAVAARYDLPKSYIDLEEAIHESDANIAVIASPADSHVSVANRVADAGMHLLIEKPLSVSLSDIDRLVFAVNEKQLVCGVAYNQRFHPLLEQAYRFLSSHRFGRPLQIVCQAGQCFPFFRPAYRDIYYKDRATGGGAIQDAMTHLLNAGEWFVGPIQQLGADARHQQLDGVGVEDTVHVITRQGLNADVMGSYSLNQYQAANEVNWSIVCEGGTLRIEVSRGRWMWQDDPAADWQVKSSGIPDRDAMHTAQANGFLDAVEGKSPPRCTLAEGIQSLKVNLAVLDAVNKNVSLSSFE